MSLWQNKIKIPEKVLHEAINGDGFKLLCQFLVNTGVKYGAVDVNDMLLNPTTVSRNCLKTETTLWHELMSKPILYIKQKQCSNTTDMWTDHYKKLVILL